MNRIKIKVSEMELTARLNDSDTAKHIWDILPFGGHANVWGEEIYFVIPLELGPENPREVVAKGDVAYWPPGKALCLFFGKTPASRGDEIRPYSPVNVVGRIEGDPTILNRVALEDIVEVTRLEE